jgi:hypothetical protein
VDAGEPRKALEVGVLDVYLAAVGNAGDETIGVDTFTLARVYEREALPAKEQGMEVISKVKVQVGNGAGR